MKQRLLSILLIIFSKQYVLITYDSIQIHATPALMHLGIEYLEGEYNLYNSQEDAVQEVYDILNCGK